MTGKIFPRGFILRFVAKTCPQKKLWGFFVKFVITCLSILHGLGITFIFLYKFCVWCILSSFGNNMRKKMRSFTDISDSTSQNPRSNVFISNNYWKINYTLNICIETCQWQQREQIKIWKVTPEIPYFHFNFISTTLLISHLFYVASHAILLQEKTSNLIPINQLFNMQNTHLYISSAICLTLFFNLNTLITLKKT